MGEVLVTRKRLVCRQSRLCNIETGSTGLHGTSSRPKTALNITHTNNDDSDTRKKDAISGTLLEKQA